MHSDDHVDRGNRWAIGTRGDGRRVLSIPVTNGLVDYEEEYVLRQDEYAAILNDPDLGLALADRCRARLEDARLVLPPGSRRGVAS